MRGSLQGVAAAGVTKHICRSKNTRNESCESASGSYLLEAVWTGGPGVAEGRYGWTLTKGIVKVRCMRGGVRGQ